MFERLLNMSMSMIGVGERWSMVPKSKHVAVAVAVTVAVAVAVAVAAVAVVVVEVVFVVGQSHRTFYYYILEDLKEVVLVILREKQRVKSARFGVTAPTSTELS